MRLRLGALSTMFLAALWLGVAHSRAVARVGRADSVASPGAAYFALRLYDQLRAKPGNLFFSPVSLRVVLALAYGGARGETATQLRRGLNLGDGASAHDEMADSLRRWESLATPLLARNALTLRVADRVWAQRGLPLADDYQQLSERFYGASVGRLDFGDGAASAQAINRWADDHTGHMIHELVPPGALDGATRLVLTNAVYFAADWSLPFSREQTHDGLFHAIHGDVTAPLMRQTDHFVYAQFAGGQLLELPYGDGDVVLDVILPARAEELALVEDQLVAGALPRWLAGGGQQLVDVTLPRFRSSWGTDFAPLLVALGMPLPFADDADFSGISGDCLKLAQVLQRAVIDVDERGTKAAAATAVVAVACSAPVQPPQPRIFRADHPFVYVIRSQRGNDLLFIGRLADPSAP